MGTGSPWVQIILYTALIAGPVNQILGTTAAGACAAPPAQPWRFRLFPAAAAFFVPVYCLTA